MHKQRFVKERVIFRVKRKERVGGGATNQRHYSSTRITTKSLGPRLIMDIVSQK
jgi:hypothetical protein